MNVYSVVAVVLDPRGRVLAVSRRGAPEDLGYPGGKVNEGEDPESAVVRELHEETGLQPLDCFEENLRNLVVLHEGPDRVAHREPRVCRAYWVNGWEGEPRAREPGIAVRWVPWARLLEERNTYHWFNRVLWERLGGDE